MNNRNYQTISIQKYPAFGLCVFPNILRALDSCRREPGLIRTCKGNATSCKLQIVFFLHPPVPSRLPYRCIVLRSMWLPYHTTINPGGDEASSREMYSEAIRTSRILPQSNSAFRAA